MQCSKDNSGGNCGYIRTDYADGSYKMTQSNNIYIPVKHSKCKALKRKAQPVARGFLYYFPDAIKAVAELSLVANDQHNKGERLHWAKEKSTDEADALMRHLIDAGEDWDGVDDDGILHAQKVAWRGMALLQRVLDKKKELEIQANEHNEF